MDNLTLEQKNVLYSYGIMHELIQNELINGPDNITVSGLAQFDQLQASGFTPDRNIIVPLINLLCAGMPPSDREVVCDMILNYDKVLEFLADKKDLES